MKKLVIFLSITIVFFLSVNQSNAQVPFCLDCPGGLWSAQHVDEWFYELPQFPGCSLHVSYWVYKCSSDPDLIYVTDMSWSLMYFGQCQSLINHFVIKQPDGSYYIDWDKFYEIDRYLYDDLASKIAKDHQVNPNLYRCGSGQTTTTVQFVNVLCKASRIVLYIGGLGTGQPFIGIRCKETVLCGDGCCYYNKEFCFNENDEPELVNESVTQDPVCENPRPPVFYCQKEELSDFLFQSPCSMSCPTIE